MVLESLLAKLSASPRGVQRLQIFLASCLGLLASIAYTHHFAQAYLVRRQDWIITPLYFFVFFAALAYLILYRFLAQRLRLFTRRMRSVWVGTAFLVSVLFVLPTIHLSAVPNHLVITATGQKNVAAQDSEVWVNSVVLPNGTQVAFADLHQQGQWETRNGVLLSYQTQPASLTWEGEVAGQVQVRFKSHSWSGIVAIQWNGQVQTIDLYTPEATEKSIQLDTVIAPTSGVFIGKKVAFALADTVTLTFILLTTGVFIIFSAGRTYTQHKLHIRRRWLLVAGFIGTLILTNILTPIFLFDPGTGKPLRFVDYILVWLYSVLALATLYTLRFPRNELLHYLPGTLPRFLQWLARPFLRQTLGVWVVACVITGLTAGLLTGQIINRNQHAYWAKLAIDTQSGTKPNILLRYGTAPDAVVPFQWQPYDSTQVAIRPINAQTTPPEVLRIDTDRGVLPLNQVTITPEQTHQSTLSIAVNHAALLEWPQDSRAFTMTLAAGTGSIEILWFDQHTTVTLGSAPTQVHLELPATLQGWALLPPEHIQQLSLEFPASATTYQLHELKILTTASAQGIHADGMLRWQPQGCVLTERRDGVQLATTTSAHCRVVVSNVQPLNVPQLLRWVGMWVIVTVVLLMLLWVLLIIMTRVQRLSSAYELQETSFGRWMHKHTAQWNIHYTILGVWVISIIFHIIYALTIPISYISDSTGYYDLGRSFVETRLFGSMNSPRTPAYPLFLGFVTRFFGEKLVWIVVFQHLVMTLLAPLVVWILAQRVSLIGAILAGILAGTLPVMSIATNILLTEPLFTLFSSAALLLYFHRGNSLRGLVVVGICCGLAVMIRPTGALALLVILGWILIEGWCSFRSRIQQLFTIYGLVAVVCGYLVVAAPWHIHLFVVRGTTDLSRGLASYTAWATTAYQQQVSDKEIANQPDAAVWAVPAAWSIDPFIIDIKYSWLIAGKSANDFRTFYEEAYREIPEREAERWRRGQQIALVYNLNFTSTPDPSYRYWGQLSSFAEEWKNPPEIPAPNAPDYPTTRLFQRLVTEWRPFAPFIGVYLLNIGTFFIRHWIWWSISALISFLVLVIVPSYFIRLFPAWLYYIGIVASSSLLSIPAERYVAIVEPLLYVLGIVLVMSILQLRYRRRTSEEVLASLLQVDLIQEV